jgi:hypothetical protein
MAESLQQRDSRTPNAVVDREMFPNHDKPGKHSGAIVAVIFIAFCALGFLAVYAVR